MNTIRTIDMIPCATNLYNKLLANRLRFISLLVCLKQHSDKKHLEGCAKNSECEHRRLPIEFCNTKSNYVITGISDWSKQSIRKCNG